MSDIRSYIEWWSSRSAIDLFVSDPDERRMRFSKLHAFLRRGWLPQDRSLYHTIRDIERSLAAAEVRISDSLVKHDPGSAGDACEEIWAEKLREQLPGYKIVTKGVISDRKGGLSRQIDILILEPDYPSVLLGNKMYDSGGVVAAFECKLNLRLSHIQKAIATASEIKASASDTVDPIALVPIYYGILALGCDIENKDKKLDDSISDALRKHDFEIIRSLNMLDAIVIADKTCFAANRRISCWDVEGDPLSMTLDRMYEVRVTDPESSSPADSPLGFFFLKLFRHLQTKRLQLSTYRKMYEFFGDYNPKTIAISSTPLESFVTSEIIEKISMNFYAEDQITFKLHM